MSLLLTELHTTWSHPLSEENCRLDFSIVPRSTKPATIFRGLRYRWQMSGNPTHDKLHRNVEFLRNVDNSMKVCETTPTRSF